MNESIIIIIIIIIFIIIYYYYTNKKGIRFNYYSYYYTLVFKYRHSNVAPKKHSRPRGFTRSEKNCG